MSENLFSDAQALDDIYGDESFNEDDLKPKASQTCSKPGHYHVYVMGVKPCDPDHTGLNSSVRLDLKILAGDNEDQKDHMIYHRVRLFKLTYGSDGKPCGREPYKPEFIAQAMRAAAGLGLINREGGVKLSQVRWDQAENCQCIVRVDRDKDEYKDKKSGETKTAIRFQINFGNFWRCDDEEVAGVPKDGEALAMLTGGAGIGGADLSNL